MKTLSLQTYSASSKIIVYIVSTNGGREVGWGFRKLAPVFQTGRSCFVLVRSHHREEAGEGRRWGRNKAKGCFLHSAWTLFTSWRQSWTHGSCCCLTVLASLRYCLYKRKYWNLIWDQIWLSPADSPFLPAAPHAIHVHTSSITHGACSELNSSDSYSDGKRRKCLEN